jgi:H+/Cl- antiporter ClcA
VTPLHWALTAAGASILLGLASVLGYTVYAMLTGRRSVSGYMKNAPRWVVAAVAFVTGLAVGVVFSHWWFPTIGG